MRLKLLAARFGTVLRLFRNIDSEICKRQIVIGKAGG